MKKFALLCWLIHASVLNAGQNGLPGTQASLTSVPGTSNTVIVVSSFSNPTEEKELGWLETGLADMLLTQLASYSNVVTVERRLLNAAMSTAREVHTVRSDIDALTYAAQKLRANYLITGHFTLSDNQLAIHAQLYKLPDKYSSPTKSVQGRFPSEISSMLAELSQEIIAEIDTDVNTEPNLRSAEPAVSPEAADSYYKGVLAFENGSFRRAARWLAETVQIDVNFSPAHNLLVTTFERLHKPKGAIQFYTQLARKHVRNPVVHNYLGSAYVAANRPDEALIAYQKALSLAPDYAPPYNNLGNICREQGMISRAREYYDKALELRIHDPAVVYNNLGLLHAGNNEFDRAEEYYLKALNLKHLPYETYFNLGNLYLKMHRYEEAIEAYKNAIEIYPLFAQAMLNLGHAYQLQGELELAEQLLTKVVDANPQNIQAAIKLAGIYLETGEYDSASRYLDTAFRHDSTSADVWKLRGLMALKKGDHAAAEHAFSSATRIEPSDWESFLCLGQLHFIRADYTQAVQHLERSHDILARLAATETSQQALILEMLAKSFEKLAQYDAALDAYRKLLRLDPDNATAQFGVKKLERRLGTQ